MGALALALLPAEENVVHVDAGQGCLRDSQGIPISRQSNGVLVEGGNHSVPEQRIRIGRSWERQYRPSRVGWGSLIAV